VDIRLVSRTFLFRFCLGVVLAGEGAGMPRTLWLLRGWACFWSPWFWVASALPNLPLHHPSARSGGGVGCSLALAILWQGELPALMELSSLDRLGVLLGSQRADAGPLSGSVLPC